MAKGYWVVAYRAIHDPDGVAAYAKAAGPVIQAGGGRLLTLGSQVVAHEAGVAAMTVVVEFDSFDAAVAAYESDGYRAALAVLGDAAERDLRIVEGIG
jgi:uncharacterized protein (DUF1330 family)